MLTHISTKFNKKFIHINSKVKLNNIYGCISLTEASIMLLK